MAILDPDREIPAAPLARTLEDHRACGSTPAHELTMNPGKTQAELMTDEQICREMKGQKEVADEIYEEARKGDKRSRELFDLVLNSFFVPNLAYLREIGRLPVEFKDFDPAKAYVFES